MLRGGARYEAFRLEVNDFTTLFGGSDVEDGTLNYDAFVFNAGGVLFLSDAADVFASFSQGFSVADVGRTLRSYGEGLDESESTSVEALGPEAIKVNGYEVGAHLSTALADASLTSGRPRKRAGPLLLPAGLAVARQRGELRRRAGTPRERELQPLAVICRPTKSRPCDD